MNNHALSHVELESSQQACGLNTFLSKACQDDKNQLVVIHPNIIDIIEGSNTITSSIASKLSRSMKMLAETYGKDNCHLYKAASFPDLTPDTILEIINCIWCHRSLDDDPASLKSVLTVLNLCGTPVNQVEFKQYVSMEIMLATSCME